MIVKSTNWWGTAYTSDLAVEIERKISYCGHSSTLEKTAELAENTVTVLSKLAALMVDKNLITLEELNKTLGTNFQPDEKS